MVDCICEVCGADFRVFRSHATRGQGRFCSRGCQGVARRGVPSKPRQKLGEQRTCQECGTPFYVPPSVIRRGHGLYCSKACASAGLRGSAKGLDRQKLRANKQRYYQKHKSDVLAKRRTWGEQNREYVQAQNREWREAHPGYAQANSKRWRVARPDMWAAEYRAGAANRRARAAGASGKITSADVRAMWARQPVCVGCGSGHGLDHIVEFWQGGQNTTDNIQNLCTLCNVRKTARLRVEGRVAS